MKLGCSKITVPYGYFLEPRRHVRAFFSDPLIKINTESIVGYGTVGTRVADPHHVNADPQIRTRILPLIKVSCESATNCQQTLQGSILNFRATIVSVHDPEF